MMQSNSISIICIIATEFCERFSFCGIRTILSLYLRNVLCLHESTATVVYHVFIMLCYVMPVAGAILADSYIGRYSVILYFSIVYLLGSLLTCCAAIPPLCFSPMWYSMIGLTMIAVGAGGIKPCVAAFGGDQFRLPQESAALRRFFTIFYSVVNLGGCAGMLATPVLRKGVACFGDDTCYALGFALPALLMLVSIVIFVIGKPWYRIKIPKNRVTLQFFSCAWYAFCVHLKQMCAENRPRPAHWLDHARDRCGGKLLSDMKVVFAMMRLYLPVPLFWSLFDQQGSRWTFQASRLQSEIAGVTLTPDQLQVMNPAMVLVLIPLCPGGVWPIFPNMSPLNKMFLGGLLAAMSFVAAGILQIAIERSTLQPPGRNEGGIVLMNTLNCSVNVNIEGCGVEAVDEHGTDVLYPLPPNVEVQITATSTAICGGRTMSNPVVAEAVVFVERRFTPVIIGQSSQDEINLRYMEPNPFSKSLTGKPKLRVAYVGEPGGIKDVSISVSPSSSTLRTYHVADTSVSESADMCISSGRVSSSGAGAVEPTGMVEAEGAFAVRPGGVYVLCARERSGLVDSVTLHDPNPPNELHLLWIVPQYLLISLAEIMFAVSGLEFSFTQAPKSMKTIAIAGWYVSVAFGNLLVILIAQARIFECQAYEFFLYAVLLACGMLCFFKLSREYQPNTAEVDGSSGEGRPLLRSVPRMVSMQSLVTSSGPTRSSISTAHSSADFSPREDDTLPRPTRTY